MSILSTKQLTKQYGTEPNIVKALDGVSISIEPGEFVAIIGTSGSGKSTLLNMLGGLDRPTSGAVRVDNYELGKLKDEDLTVFRRQRIGFVFQNYNLVPILNVYENIVRCHCSSIGSRRLFHIPFHAVAAGNLYADLDCICNRDSLYLL